MASTWVTDDRGWTGFWETMRPLALRYILLTLRSLAPEAGRNSEAKTIPKIQRSPKAGRSLKPDQWLKAVLKLDVVQW